MKPGWPILIGFALAGMLAFGAGLILVVSNLSQLTATAWLGPILGVAVGCGLIVFSMMILKMAREIKRAMKSSVRIRFL